MKYWVIKTTEGGPNKINHWEDFKSDSTIAVGWAMVQDNPADFSSEQEYLARLEAQYDWSGRDVNHVASTIYDFAKSWETGDLAIICGGYTPNQSKDVILYGFAIVVDYYFDPNPQWRCKFKRKAEISIVEREIPKEIFVNSLGMESMIGATNGPFSERQFCTFIEKVRNLYPWK